MQKQQLLFLLLFGILLNFSYAYDPIDWKANFQEGDPEIQSINSMAFGPEGILFLGDSKSAAVVALDTKDMSAEGAISKINMTQVDEKIAALLGTTADAIMIQDMAVNPVSHMIYLAVHMQDGTPFLMRTAGESFEHVALEVVSYSKIALEAAVGEDAKDRRGRSLRKWSISDLGYHDGKVMVSGLSNEEFSSTFRSIPFPFSSEQMHASLEIYHAAHGRYETYAPIKTFMTFDLKDEPHLVASYTCTPLVLFPLSEIQNGKHTKGRTVAELGNRNTPLDMISYKKQGKDYLLLANTSRALMKINPEDINAYTNYLTEPVKESSATAGVKFLALPYVNVQQLDKFDEESVVMLQRMANGDLNLHTPDIRRL